MLVFPVGSREEDRIAALTEYGISVDSMGTELDAIIRLAANLFEVPTVLVSLVESQRQIFAARIGLDVCETERSVSFCAHALDRKEVLIILDATLDPRFFDNPLVTGAPWIRFYAGAPLVTLSGLGIGTLCIIDDKPHNGFSEGDQRNLKDMASLVLDKMELRRVSLAGRASQMRFEQIAAQHRPMGLCAPTARGQFAS